MDRFDLIIRTQAEFEAMYNSPTWFNAVSVCFIGNGGALKFTRNDGMGLLIPQTVKGIKGLNSATIDIIDMADGQAVLWYQTKPTANDYWIDGLTISCKGLGKGYLFFNCTRLSNCSGVFTSPNKYTYGFYECTHLMNCSIDCSGESGVYGFYSCTDLINCNGNCLNTGNVAKFVYCFNKCTQLTNCIGVGGEIGFTRAFYRCTQLTNCSGTTKGTNGCFSDCTQLTNCVGVGTSPSSFAYGFEACNQLVNCIGTGISEKGSESYSFYDCSYLNGCKQGATPSTTGFLGGTNTKVDTLTAAPTATS